MKESYAKLGFGTRVAVYLIATLVAVVIATRVTVLWTLNVTFLGFLHGAILNLSSWLYLIIYCALVWVLGWLRKLVVSTNTMRLNVTAGLVMRVIKVICLVIAFIVFVYNFITVFQYTGILIGIMYGLMACVGWEMAAEFFKSLGVVFGDTDAAEEE